MLMNERWAAILLFIVSILDWHQGISVVWEDWVAGNISGPNVQKILSSKQETCRDI